MTILNSRITPQKPSSHPRKISRDPKRGNSISNSGREGRGEGDSLAAKDKDRTGGFLEEGEGLGDGGRGGSGADWSEGGVMEGFHSFGLEDVVDVAADIPVGEPFGLGGK